MLNLPKTCVLFDTEYTSWEGAMARDWSGPNEYKEIVQIGSIIIDTETFEEKGNLVLYIKPVKNPKLSDYFIELTGVTQKEVDDLGTSLGEALENLGQFAGSNHFYSFGGDENVIKENCNLLDMNFPLDTSRFHNICDTFEMYGVSTKGFMSSTIVRALGGEPKYVGHDGLNDARGILDGLRLLADSVAKKGVMW